MLTVNHNNASLESYNVRHLGYDVGNIAALANADELAYNRLLVEEFSPPSTGRSDSMEDVLLGDDSENFPKTPTSSKRTITASLVNSVLEREIGQEGNGDGDEEPFFVCDLGIVVKQFDRWKTLLPRVEPFYAIKCNTNKALLNTLVNLGTGFDCASKVEIATMLDLGVDPSKIIYANPCKPSSHIRYAREKGVQMMTFDNLDELAKIKHNFPEADLLLRIVTDDSKSTCKFSVKFGAALSSVEPLLKAALAMELNVIGVSFHVGSGCMDAAQYNAALKSARFVFEKACEIGFGPQFHLLDIGGGFPGVESEITLEQIADAVNEALDVYFPPWDFPYLRVIAEPGRYFATAAFTLAVCVTSRRVLIDDKDPNSKTFMYYLNDGVYGSFNCIFFDHAIVKPEVFTLNGHFLSGSETFDDTNSYNCSIWGPTCDSIDCISKDAKLPELDVGDWLVFRNMGAYTTAAATNFNGFSNKKVIYINQGDVSSSQFAPEEKAEIRL